jgi:2'-5' RNA ligase
MRVFLALPMADSAKAAFGRLIDKLKPQFDDARWVPAANLHLTLVFIGEIKRTLVPDLVECVSDASSAFAAKHGRFSDTDLALTFYSLGFFGSPRYPRVLFAKPPQAESHAKTTDIADAGEIDAASAAGIPGAVKAISALTRALRDATAQYAKPGDSPFKPHLTLARFRRLERGDKPSARNELVLRLLANANARTRNDDADGSNVCAGNLYSAHSWARPSEGALPAPPTAAPRGHSSRDETIAASLRFEPIASVATRFILYESIFDKSGVSYSEIASFPLAT